jgi:hypothetical protein
MTPVRLICLCLILLLPAAAGTARAQQGQAGGHLLIGFPVGAFKDRIGGPGFGLAGHLAYSLPEQPYLIGLQLGFLNTAVRRSR